MAAVALGLGYFYWNDAIDLLRAQLDSYQLVDSMTTWLQGLGLGDLRLVMAPALLLFMAIPVIVIVSLLFVALLMTPTMVALIAERRFPLLQRRQGASFWASLLWSLASTLMACLALLLTLPLWLIPPLVLVVPPLIWGWLTYRVMTYDALAEHATAEERGQVFKQHRIPLLCVGVLRGFTPLCSPFRRFGSRITLCLLCSS